MTSENKRNIDEVIDHFINNSNGKISDTAISQIIELKKLALEEQKHREGHQVKLQEIELAKQDNQIKYKQTKFPNNILNNPTTAAALAALAGFSTATLVAFIQGRDSFQLEQLKFQSNLIVKATESPDLEQRIKLLSFNIKLGLIKDPALISQLEKFIKEEEVPQSISFPNNSILPTVIKYRGPLGCYIAAYSHEKENSTYPVGNDIYIIGKVRVEGIYQRGICQPKGYEGKDISGLDYFKELFDKELPSFCRNKSCWAGGDTP